MIRLALLCSGLVVASPEAPGPGPAAAYEAAKERAGRGADAQVKLALWCEAHGLEAERLKHLAVAVLTDPKNATARGLMGLVSFDGRWRRPEAVSDRLKDGPARAALLEQYRQRRAKAPYEAEPQWRLALWCEENGLKAEALAHLTAVTRLDPAREAAWKHLGCKKHNGRWMTDAQLDAEKAEGELQ